MRILLVVHGFPPLAQGGSELYAHATARELRRQGDDVLVLTREQEPGRAEYTVRHESREGFDIAWVNNTFESVRSFRETYNNDAITAEAERLIDEFRPQVAHVHHLTCLSTGIVPALARRRLPVFVTLHDYWMMCHRGQFLDLNYRVCEGPARCHACVGVAGSSGAVGFAGASILRTVERRLPVIPGLRTAAEWTAQLLARESAGDDEARRRADHMRGLCADVARFLAPSRYIRDRFVEFGVQPDRISLSPYGIDPAPFQAERTGGDRLRVGFLGSLMISKGPHVLLEAVKGLPPASISVELFGQHTPYHGDDSYRQTLEPLAAQQHVTIRGQVARERIPEILAGLDVLVVPSLWPENSPFVIQEAQLAGVPVVASNIGGIPELVDHGRNGFLFEAGNADALRTVLAQLIESPEALDGARRERTPVRTLTDDVAAARALYKEHVRESRASAAMPAETRSGSASRRRLAAVVLNYRTPDDTLLATRALLASDRPLDSVIVIDNDRDRPAAAALGDVMSQITYHLMNTNLGFSGGMNAGIRLALKGGAERVLLVNSDAIVPPDTIARLEAALDSTPRAGIAGPLILSRARPDRVDSAGMIFNPATGRMRHRGHGTGVVRAAGSIEVVSGVSGCVMLITRDALESTGLLDEDYFFGFEDLDLCLRAAHAGFSTIVATSAVAYHEGGRSIGARSTRRLYFASRNHLRVANCTAPLKGAASLARSGMIVGLNLAHAAGAEGGSIVSRLLAVARGARDYAFGRFGADRGSL